eukprot:m.65371 g.65371  ORF g.65371 m.65371 type:complete len:775 (-) comp13662_c0_seq1:62-2386(-)
MVKLYHCPGTSGEANYVAAVIAGIDFEGFCVDLGTKKVVGSGEDFLAINPKGNVPCLVLDDGTLLVENVATLTWIAANAKTSVGPRRGSKFYGLVNVLSFLASEVHSAYFPIFGAKGNADLLAAAAAGLQKAVTKLVNNFLDGGKKQYLFGDSLTVADVYATYILGWTEYVKSVTPLDDLPLNEAAVAYKAHIDGLPAIQAARDLFKPDDGAIAVVLTNHRWMGATGKKTGWYLPEVAHPLKVFKDAGKTVVFVSPLGGATPMDPGSYTAFKDDPVCADFLANSAAQWQVQHTRSAADFDPSKFAAVFYAGGHGPMFDLPENKELAEKSAQVYKNGGVIAAVCHGPVGLVPITIDGEPLVKGKTVTCFTNTEEEAVELTKVMPFLLETKLGELGATFKRTADWGCNVETSERVVTGQNPASATATGEAVVALLPSTPAAASTAAPIKQGFGCMGITAFYGDAMADEDGVALLEQVYGLGVRHFDTAEMYRTGNPFDMGQEDTKWNETVVGKFAKKVGRENVTIATKFHPGKWKDDCSLETITKSLDLSLARLGMDYVDVYYMHRLPENFDVVAFMTACKKLVADGKIKAVGLSEVSAAKIREANAVFKLSYVQQEWSLLTRIAEDEIAPTCAELGIKIVAYSPLARNLLSGVVTEAPTDWRATLPRYAPENLEKNMKLMGEIKNLAESKQCSAAQLSLAWLLARAKAIGVTVIPIPGTTKIKHAADNVASEKVQLTDADITKLEEIGAQVAGDRADEAYQARAVEGQADKTDKL